MTEEEEDKYVFAQDLTRLRIAINVLHEVTHEEFQVKDILESLHAQVADAFRRLTDKRAMG